jgi:hypothetical protein
VLRSAVSGTTPHQVLSSAWGERMDAVIASASASLPTSAFTTARHRGCRVDALPSLADL